MCKLLTEIVGSELPVTFSKKNIYIYKYIVIIIISSSIVITRRIDHPFTAWISLENQLQYMIIIIHGPLQKVDQSISDRPDGRLWLVDEAPKGNFAGFALVGLYMIN